MTRKRKAPTPKGKGRRGGRPVADRLAVHPVSMADQAAIKDELVANAAFQVEAFPQLQADLLTLFRRVHPLHLIAIVGQYGLFAPVSNQGIADGTLMEGIQQHHVELMQAFALALSDAEWGVSPATPKDVEQAVDTVKALADAFHARRFLEAENVEEKSERYRLMLREKIRLHTQMIRNWGHFGQVVDITRRLYLPLDPLLREAHGFAGTELISVAKAMLDLHQKRSSARFQQLQRVFAEQTVRGAVSRYYALFMPSEDPAPFLAMLPAEWPLDTVRQRLLAHADTQLARQASYAPDDLAATTGLPAGVVNAVLGALAFAPGALASMDREHLFLGNPVWTVPAIDLGSDYFVPAPQSIFSFIHAIMRRLATTPELKKALERRRAEFLETELAELLAEALPGAQVQSDIAWSLDGRRYQTDVVAKLDRVVVIAEAKSAALTEAALRGAPERVRKHVGELIVEPSQQSLRLAGLIERASGGDADARAILTPFGDDFFDVDEVVRLSVTLDDFSIIASSEPELRLVARLACLTGGAKNRLLVIAQHRQPRCDVIRMPHGRRDSERSAGERRRHLRDKLFFGVCLGTETSLLVPVEPAAVAGPMAQLVQRSAIPVDGFRKRRLRRHLHKVMARAVKGFAPADIDPRAGRRDQRVGLGNREHRVGADHRREIVFG